ncbi:MAG: hypothetical protein F4138_07655 [Acidimicrobiia bacterium]|nr:hypothetical protein [Acidimicrobiia bacterium]MYC57547.1 hypothetical protein [Acidimicrobiia bacterium]MYG94838.1 hypothetical protein [Acidimicrobiia bacterium]MYI30089.1 hypothetical protein [Acidimicrobiia bacterium]
MHAYREQKDGKRLHCADSLESGQSSVIFVTLAVVLVMVGGLAYDGAQILNAKRQVSLLAREAARAGAQAISSSSPYEEGDLLAINPALAHNAVADFLEPHSNYSVVVLEDTVSTTIWLTQPVRILSMLGIDAQQVMSTGTARAVRGIQTESTQ